MKESTGFNMYSTFHFTTTTHFLHWCKILLKHVIKQSEDENNLQPFNITTLPAHISYPLIKCYERFSIDQSNEDNSQSHLDQYFFLKVIISKMHLMNLMIKINHQFNMKWLKFCLQWNRWESQCIKTTVLEASFVTILWRWWSWKILNLVENNEQDVPLKDWCRILFPFVFYALFFCFYFTRL